MMKSIDIKNKLLFLFLLSGFSALIYEVVWVKLFGYLFGISVYSVSTVIAIFMLGLGIGSYIFGKYIDNVKMPVNTYIFLEIGIALYAFIFPFLYVLLNKIIIFYYNNSSQTTYDLLVKVVLAVIFLIIPTVLMGGTLPVMSKLIVKGKEEIGVKIGELYAFNTYGGVIGVLVAAYILIPNIGLNNTIFTTAIINILIASYLLFLKNEISHEYKATIKEKITKSEYSPIVLKTVLVCFLISGFISLSYEVLWFRMLLPIFGLDVYAFSIMLAFFLWGLATGSLYYAKKLKEVKNHLLMFGLIELLIGLTATFTFVLHNKLDIFPKQITAYLIIIVPTFLMGLTFPVVNKLYVSRIRIIGARVGSVYSLNIIGGILGSILTGFWILKKIGTSNGIIAMASANLILGLVIIIMTLNLKNKVNLSRYKKALTTSLAALIIVILVGAFIIIQQKPSTYNIKIINSTSSILLFSEGLNANVKVIQNNEERILMLNTKVMASTAHQDMKLLKLISHIPLMLHQEPKDVLVIGLGAGVSAGVASLYNLSTLEVAELSENMLEAAALFKEYNYDVLNNKKVNIIIVDGRNYLLRTDKQYDVITSDPIDPFIAGAGNLYSKEHYEQVKKKLKSDGIAAQWIVLHQMSSENLKVTIATFNSVFEHTSIWFTGIDLVMIGSKNDLSIDYERLKQRIKEDKILQDLNTIMINNSAEFLSHYVTNEKRLKELTKGVKINSDNNPVLEYSTPKDVGKLTISENIKLIMENRERIIPLLTNISERDVDLINKYFDSKAIY